MTRPRYETEDHVAAERGIATIVGVKWKCEVAKLPGDWCVDFVAHRCGKAVAWLEVKDRPNYDYDTLERLGGPMIGMDKIDCINRDLIHSGLKVFYVTRLKDGIFYRELRYNEPHNVQITGRTDRNDPGDIKPHAIIPMDQFRYLDAD